MVTRLLLRRSVPPAPECGWDTSRPLQVDVDIAFVVDGSRGAGANLYRSALTLVDVVLEELEVARQPSMSPRGARVALVTHMTPGFWPGGGRSPVLEGFHLPAYGHQSQMQRSVREAVGHPLRGAPALGCALEWTLEKVLLASPLLWRAQVLFAIVASETSNWDREKLRTLSPEANCKGGLCPRRPIARASLCLCWPWAQAWGPTSWQSWSTWPAPPGSSTCCA